MNVQTWINVVYMPFNVREAVRMLRSDMDRDAIANFLESCVSSWPNPRQVAMGAFMDGQNKDHAIAVESAGREIAARITAEMEPHG